MSRSKGEIIAQLSLEFDGYTSFLVKNNESIHEIANRSENRERLPLGYCNMVFYDVSNGAIIWGKSPRKTGLGGRQNIFDYFQNSGSKDFPKWQQIQNEMRDNNIQVIEVAIFFHKP